MFFSERTRAHLIGNQLPLFGPRDVLGVRRVRRLLVGRVFGCTDDVGCVQKGGALETDVDERRLHARQHAAHAPLINITHQPAAIGALDERLLEHAVLDNGHPRLTGRNVDEQLGTHALVPFPRPANRRKSRSSRFSNNTANRRINRMNFTYPGVGPTQVIEYESITTLKSPDSGLRAPIPGPKAPLVQFPIKTVAENCQH